MKKLLSNISFSDWFMIAIIIFQLGMSFAKLSYIEQKLDALSLSVEKQINYVQEKLDNHIAGDLIRKLGKDSN
jgi:hypothetical protein